MCVLNNNVSKNKNKEIKHNLYGRNIKNDLYGSIGNGR